MSASRCKRLQYTISCNRVKLIIIQIAKDVSQWGHFEKFNIV